MLLKPKYLGWQKLQHIWKMLNQVIFIYFDMDFSVKLQAGELSVPIFINFYGMKAWC